MSDKADRATTRDTTAVSGWVPSEWPALLSQLARENDRTVSGEVRAALRRHLKDSGLIAA